MRKHQFEKALEKLSSVKTITALNPPIPFHDNIVDLLVQGGCGSAELIRVWDIFVKLDRTYDGWRFWQYLASRNCATALREMHRRHFPIEWNEKTSSGDTALHIAVQNRRYEAVQALLEADVDTTIKNRLYLTAESMGDDKIKRIFERHRLGDTVLMLTSEFDAFRQTTEERFAGNEVTLEDVSVRLSKLERGMYSVNPR